MREGRHKSYHVCILDPCPFRPINKPRFDDHRGLPFVTQGALDDTDSDDEELQSLSPNMHLVVRRYVWPFGQGTGKNTTLAPDSQRSPKIGTYVTHNWAEPFADFVQTLRTALDGEDTVFVPGLMMGSGAVIHGRTGGTGNVEQRPWATALRKAERLLVVADRALGFAQCVWCAFEIMKAREMQLPAVFWPHEAADLGKLKETLGRIDIEAAAEMPCMAAAATNESEEIRQALGAAILGKPPDNEAASRQLRSFLQKRVKCFISALRGANEFREFNPERLRLLCAEQERRATVKEASGDHSRHMERMRAEVQERNKVIQRLHHNADVDREAHQAEVRHHKRQLELAAQEEAILRGQRGSAEANFQRAETDLKDARAVIIALRRELEAERRQGEEERESTAKAKEEAAELAMRIKELEADAMKEREAMELAERSWKQCMETREEELVEERRSAEGRFALVEEHVHALEEKLAEAEELAATRLKKLEEDRSILGMQEEKASACSNSPDPSKVGTFLNLGKVNTFRRCSKTNMFAENSFSPTAASPGEATSRGSNDIGSNIASSFTHGVSFFMGKTLSNKPSNREGSGKASQRLQGFFGTKSKTIKDEKIMEQEPCESEADSVQSALSDNASRMSEVSGANRVSTSSGAGPTLRVPPITRSSHKCGSIESTGK